MYSLPGTFVEVSELNMSKTNKRQGSNVFSVFFLLKTRLLFYQFTYSQSLLGPNFIGRIAPKLILWQTCLYDTLGMKRYNFDIYDQTKHWCTIHSVHAISRL